MRHGFLNSKFTFTMFISEGKGPRRGISLFKGERMGQGEHSKENRAVLCSFAV